MAGEHEQVGNTKGEEMLHEDLTELAESIANLCGVYGIGPECGDHPDDCKCRMCFVGEMEDRIREAARVERLLNED